MDKLCCDICGGTLIMMSGGKTAICDSCGMQYSVERMREKVQEIRGTVSIEGTVKTQNADFIIRGGVLERYNGNDIHVIIPDSVVEIDKEAFMRCVGIQSIIFPPNVKEIGLRAFCGCASLNEIKLPDGVEEIEPYAFCGCRSLKQINLPESVVRIGYGAFYGTGITNIEIPSSVTYIGESTFADCKFLTKVKLPDGLKFIEKEAFYDCPSLEIINIPDQVEGGKENLKKAFGLCPALKEVIISEEQKERLFVCRSAGHSGDLRPAMDIFEESKIEYYYPGDDDYGHTVYSDKNCGPWYRNFKRKFEVQELERLRAERRARNKCQHCGGTFSGLFIKKCTRCGKQKDYE